MQAGDRSSRQEGPDGQEHGAAGQRPDGCRNSRFQAGEEPDLRLGATCKTNSSEPGLACSGGESGDGAHEQPDRQQDG